jgi:hypothetical protein
MLLAGYSPAHYNRGKMGLDRNAELRERADSAAVAPRHRLAPFFRETAKEVLIALAGNPNLAEGDLLKLLERKDLPREAIQQIAVHRAGARSYSLKLGIVRHPKAPRLVSLPLLKFLYLFDLVRVSQTPGVPADVKMAAEETILRKLEAVPRGEKITLARRASGRVAAELLVSEDPELIRAALENPYLSEAHLQQTLSREDLPRIVVESLAVNGKWSCRYFLRLALIRNPLTPLLRVLEFLPDLAVTDLRDICQDRRMPEQVRKYVLAHCADRLQRVPRP